ncbi:MAG: protein kinase [Rhodothermales bacterium]|nr:protein kinase [Rhodothermales bacterium]
MIGTTISHYRIIEQLGRGGMGVVYKAEDTRLHRPVALKFLPPQRSGNEEAKQRFMQEARAASALDHANICSIFDIGEAPQPFGGGVAAKAVTSSGIAPGLPEATQLFIVMAFYEGQTLKYRLDDGPLPVDDCVDIGSQIAVGLQCAHEAGIVHRDIKPANIMVTDRGEVKILDFGVAKLAGGHELTKIGSTLGTAAYMSPEQARSEVVDHRADLWSLGVILYEMMAGRRPFEGDYEAAIAYSILNAEPTPVENLRADIPVHVSEVVHRLLSKDPDARFQSAAEAVAALQGAATTSPTIASSTPRRADPSAPAQRRLPRAAVWAAAAVVVLTAAIFGIRGLTGSSEPAVEPTTAPEGPRAIAVLPFTDLSPDRDSEYMGDGIAEELIYALSKLKNMQVAARTSSFYFKGRNEDINSIAEQLGVDLVLDGSIRRDGEALRVTAELVNAADGFQLWSERYDRRVDDVFAVQEDITRAIVDALQIELTGAESTRLNQRGTENLEAYTLYLRGRQQWNLRTREGLANSVELFKQAIDRDPNYARAHAGLADAYIITADWGFMPGQIAREQGLAAAKQAIALDPDLPEGIIAMAAIDAWYDHNYESAISRFEKALQLDPGYATGHQWLGEVLSGVGRCREGADHMKRAIELDPLSPIINSAQSLPYLCLRDYDEVERLSLRALDVFPGFDLTRTWLAFAHMGKGDLDRAEEIVTDCGSGDCAAVRGMIWGIRGQTEKARAILQSREITELESQRLIFQSWIHIGMGELDEAFDLLNASIPGGNSYLIYVGTWEIYDSLRDHPRYATLMEDLGTSDVR